MRSLPKCTRHCQRRKLKDGFNWFAEDGQEGLQVVIYCREQETEGESTSIYSPLGAVAGLGRKGQTVAVGENAVVGVAALCNCRLLEKRNDRGILVFS